MLKKTIIGFMLALFAGPLSAHAELPGQPCTAAQIGTTKMADDKQNIIACLETGKAAPENVQEWKAMTSSGGGGGVTGGCTIDHPGNYRVVGLWGKGCTTNIVPIPNSELSQSYWFPVPKPEPGYACGPTGRISNSVQFYLCSKN
ncbi:MAG: hypothetical protein IPI58_07195 [Alphaproteobacteria bacterium]|nr:MAG: hypothetical protein IPI58_07195 [Alphaproteobacteria bacterium]